jgi:hypothetical protein
MSDNHDTGELRRTKRLNPPDQPPASADQRERQRERAAETRMSPPASAPRPATPLVPPAPRQPVHRLPPKPVNTKAPRRNTSLLPPLWSIVVTVLLVAICAASLVLAVLLLGGNTAPAEPPRVIVLTAAPITTFSVGSTVLVTATLPPEVIPAQLGLPATFVMAGPTLAMPVITPTPLKLEIGSTVRVIDVGDQQLNVRERPGVIDVPIEFLAPENALFVVVEGPNQADGLTWWRIQDAERGQTGWAASNYLEVVPTSDDLQP